MDTLVSTDWLADHLDDDDLRVLDCTVILEAGRGGWLPGRLGTVALGRGPHPRLRLRRPDRRPVRSVVAAALHAAHGRALRGGHGAARRRRGHPGRALRPPPQHVGGPPVVDAAGVRLRRRRRARRRLAGLDGRGQADVDRAGHRSPGGVPRQAPPGPVRRPRRGARRARRRRHLPAQRPVRGAAPGRGVTTTPDPGHLPGSAQRARRGPRRSGHAPLPADRGAPGALRPGPRRPVGRPHRHLLRRAASPRRPTPSRCGASGARTSPCTTPPCRSGPPTPRSPSSSGSSVRPEPVT